MKKIGKLAYFVKEVCNTIKPKESVRRTIQKTEKSESFSRASRKEKQAMFQLTKQYEANLREKIFFKNEY